MRKLGALIEIIKGRKAPDVFDKPRPGTQRYLQIEDLRPGAVLKYARDDKGVLASTNDVLIAWDGANAGTVGFGLTGYAGSTISILRPSPKQIYASYLGYFLRSKFDYIQMHCTGATIPHVSRQSLEMLLVPLPPLEEQQRIAGILARADRLRRLRRFAADLGSSYLQSVFLKMFGDPVTNPMGWEIKTLKQLKTRLSYGTSAKCYFEPNGLPVLRIPNVLGGQVSLKDLKYVELPDKDVKKLSLYKGDLLFVRTNGNPDYVGRCAVFNLSKPCLYASYLIRARLDMNIINPLFLATYLRMPSGRQAMLPFIRTTAGQSNIGMEGLGQIPVPVPPTLIQEKFIAVVRRFETLRAQQWEAERQAEHLFQTLLHRAFTGDT